MIKGIFIVGAGRSGTKFMMNVLNNNSSIHLAPEIHFFSSLFHSGFRKNLRKKYKQIDGQYGLDDVVECILDGKHFGTYWRRENGITDAGIREWFKGRDVSEENIYKYLIEHDVSRYGDGKEVGITLRGEKGGSNIFHLNELLEWFPDASVIFMYRNPLDVLKSEVNKGSKPDYPLNKRNPLYAYGLVPAVFLIWALGAMNVLRYKRKYNNIHLVSYEQMVKRLDEVTRTITALCGVEYSERMCNVMKEDSSFNSGEVASYWNPPGWVMALYSILLNPLRKKLDSQSIHHDTDALSI